MRGWLPQRDWRLIFRVADASYTNHQHGSRARFKAISSCHTLLTFTKAAESVRCE